MTKTCKICGLEKDAVQGIWVMRHGKPCGKVCLKCHAERTQQYRATEEGRAKARASNRKHLAIPENRAKKNASSKKKCQSLVTLETGEVVTYGAAQSRKDRATDEGRAKKNASNRATTRKVRSTPEGRAKSNAATAEWQRLHRARALLSQANTHQYNPKKHPANRAWYAALLRQTPPWVDDSMLDQMDVLYASRKQGESTDHIVPLVGKDLDGNHIVSGLNVPWNLQIIPQVTNSRKGNWFNQV